MKNVKKQILLTIVVVALISFNLYAQNIEGIAMYKSEMRDLPELSSIGENNISPQMAELIKQRVISSSKKEFSLSFNANESLFLEKESLNKKDNSSSGGIQIAMTSTNFSSKVYKNTANNELLQEVDFMGKLFLVKDSLSKYEWKLTEETKKIGAYTAKKALLSLNYSEASILQSSDDGKKEKKAPRKKNYETEVWYTPEIAVSHGPGEYWGLPGLILEVHDPHTSVVCDKITLNPKKPIKIKKPKKGKQVTKAELPKMEDIMSQF